MALDESWRPDIFIQRGKRRAFWERGEETRKSMNKGYVFRKKMISKVKPGSQASQGKVIVLSVLFNLHP